MSSRQIFPLFSTPIDVNNLGEFSKPDLRFVEYTHLTPAGESYGFLGSVDKNVLDRPELTEIRALVKNEIEFCSRARSTPLHREWSSTSPNNSLLSGVLYLQASDAGGAIVFHKDLHGQRVFPLAPDPETSSSNIYNCKDWGTCRRRAISASFRPTCRTPSSPTTRNSRAGPSPSTYSCAANSAQSTSCI